MTRCEFENFACCADLSVVATICVGPTVEEIEFPMTVEADEFVNNTSDAIIGRCKDERDVIYAFDIYRASNRFDRYAYEQYLSSCEDLLKDWR